MSTFLNVIRTAELRKKILFTLMVVVIYRLGSQIPVPGVNLDALQSLTADVDSGNGTDSGGLFAYLSILTGSQFQLTLFGLGILPYITASIIIQILTVAVPKLEEWQSQGASGQAKISQWTRYITIVLTLIQSTGIVYLMSTAEEQLTGTNYGLFEEGSMAKILLAVLAMTTGTAIVMWMAEAVTEKGIGNGMSVLIFAAVVSVFPTLIRNIYVTKGWVWLGVALLLVLFLTLGIVFVELGQRRIPVNFAKRVVGRKQYGGNKSYIPLKVNQAGVIPVIFAGSLLILPNLLANLLPTNAAQDSWGDSVRGWVAANLQDPTNIGYMIAMSAMIVGFAYFYNSIAFDPARRADDLRKSGGFVPGVRPGPQTESYLAKILNRITLPGSLFLALIAIVPSALLAWLLGGGATSGSLLLGFSGVSILIGVGVSLEIMKQINSQLMARNYDGFLS